MTANQTIDGVPRERIQQIIADIERGGRLTAVEKLRALLDKEVGGDSRAPYAQGEQVAHMPVERCYDVRAKMIIAFNEAKKAGGDLDDALDAAYKSALRFSPNPPAAEQPAPVAVVMPERMEPRDPYDDEANQWNACLDEVNRLNGIKS